VVQREQVQSEMVAFVQAELSAKEDPAKAGPMAAYMKTSMPFYGVQNPQRRPIARQVFKRFTPADNTQYREQVEALWALPHREEKYIAVGIACRHERFITMENLDLYRRLITEGAWWDFVDEVSQHLIGRLLAKDPARVRPILEEWIADQDIWLRRTAIICQIGMKASTDQTMLFAFCRARAHEKEFFIRKAIGWALREYAKTNPDEVRRFLTEHREFLSGLSYREASKHL
jgi:3-methyladenine DNA glycosylase AlkD